MTNEAYIHLHRDADTRALALKKAPEGVDLPYCLEQIRNAQRARGKLPGWLAVEGLVFPPSLSVEQCSSESTARYKQQLVARLFPHGGGRMADLTGGFGVDFAHMAKSFAENIYIEAQERLCQIARHNMPLLGVEKADIRQTDAATFLEKENSPLDLIYIDPARRDKDGKRTVMLADCQPSVPELMPRLRRLTRYLLLKLSPMLDIHAAVQALGGAEEVHVVSVGGECKELLLLADMRQAGGKPGIHCADMARPADCLALGSEEETGAPEVASRLAAYLYEPCAGVLKAGIQDVLCRRMRVAKLHPCSNLFTSDTPLPHFPGRGFRVVGLYDFSKQSLKQLRQDTPRANIATRNFPATPEELRRRLRLKDGGTAYLFATTLSGERHAIIRCEKI